jgi:DNA-binding MarR family transcriptional regulator
MASEDTAVAEIEQGLSRLLRGTLLRLHDRVTATTGVALERASYWVLACLTERGPLRLSELAQVMTLDPSTVSRHVGQLERQGLVGRETDPTDARAVLLALTPEGTDVVGRLRSGRHELMQQVLDCWPADDRRELARLLCRFAADLTAACARQEEGRT